MDALRRSLAIMAAVVAAVICIVPIAEDSDAYGEMSGVMLYEVNPWNDNEGVSLYNYGTRAVDIKGYSISDYPTLGGGEGYITVTGSITIQPKSFIIIASEYVDPKYDSPVSYVDRTGVTVYYYDGANSDLFKEEGRFELSNSKDDVYLWNASNEVIDAMCYGSTLITDSDLWFGGNVSISNDTFVQRRGTFDNDSAEDWFRYVPGLTNREFDENLKFDATVTPFLFPDSGGIPVYQALESATDYVYITIYQLSSVNVYALLCDLSNRGVDVKLLMEGDSLSGTRDFISTVEPYLRILVDNGVEVRLIGVGGEGVVDRYNFVHAKYAVIDGDTVVVTSENWTPNNMNGKEDDNPYSGNDGNRGWGAIIESEQYANYMLEVFENDYSMSYGDVKEFTWDPTVPNTVGSISYTGHDDASFDSYSAKVTPVMSNDNSYNALKHYISNAQDRIYTEQQSLGATYRNLSDTSPVTMMSKKANEGVECIAIFDDTEEANEDQVDVINKSTLISAALMTGTTLHNKGIVCDNYSWVSSINWTFNSFNNNREVCVVIESADIADMFAKCILKDFEQYYDYDGFRIVPSEIEDYYLKDQEISFSVTVYPEGDYTYVWDLGDGSAPFESVSRIVCKPAFTGDAQVYTLSVSVTDNDTKISRTISFDYTILAEAPDDGGTGNFDSSMITDNLTYIVPIIVVILGMIMAALKSSGKKKGKSTKSKKRK